MSWMKKKIAKRYTPFYSWYKVLCLLKLTVLFKDICILKIENNEPGKICIEFTLAYVSLGEGRDRRESALKFIFSIYKIEGHAQKLNTHSYWLHEPLTYYFGKFLTFF